MSGAAGGSRINKENLKATIRDYRDNVLKPLGLDKSYDITGIRSRPEKNVFGDIDIVVSFPEGDKSELKKKLGEFLDQINQIPVIPKKGKKYFIHGNIVSTLYPIQGKEGEYVQIDNIVTVSKEEGKFTYKMLDLPAQEQVLAIGLVKAIFTELDEAQIEKLFKDLNIPDTDKPGEGEEYDFNLNPSELSLKIVPIGKSGGREIWKSNNFKDVKTLLSYLDIDIEKDKFDSIISKIKKFKNRRSIDRLKGMFAKNIRVGDAEAGTEKGDKKQQALDTVSSLEEKYDPLVLELIRPFLLEDENKKTIAVFPGKFKPPHKDHIARIKAASADADEVIVIVSPKTEPGGTAVSKKKKEELEARLGTEMPITLEQSLELFKKLNLPSNIKVIAANDPSLPAPSPSPVSAAYELFINNPQQQYIAVFGKEEDLNRFGQIPQNVTVKNYSGAAGNLSATDLRTALKKGEDIKKYMPDGITPEEYKSALGLEEEAVKEGTCGYDTNAETGEKLDTPGGVSETGRSSPYGSGYKPLILEISKFMINQGMEIQPLPKVQFIDDDADNAQDILGTTAYYDPQSKTIVLYTLDRHPKDILRSFCHEMVHHEQNMKGTLGNIKTQNTTEDSHLDEIEREAYERGNIMFRNWTDSLSKKTWQPDSQPLYSGYGVQENDEKMREEKEDKGTGGYEIYCDMDGVLCDFDKRFMEFSNSIPPEEYESKFGKKAFWKLINEQGVEFWADIPWISGGEDLWEYIKPYNPSLLSAPSSKESSRSGKHSWVKNNIPGTKLILRSAEQKQEFAKPNAILIDDRLSNIEQWRAKGGIGILHTSVNQTIEQLKELGL